MQVPAQVTSERVLIALLCLDFDNDPLLLPGLLSELLEQHRLADTTQSGNDHGLLCPAARQSRQEDIEGRQLIIASDDHLRFSPGVGGVGIRDRVHPATLGYLGWFSDFS